MELELEMEMKMEMEKVMRGDKIVAVPMPIQHARVCSTGST